MIRYENYNDHQLWSLLQEGDQNAFVEFFNRRSDGIFVIISKIVKDEEISRDMLQEVFIRAWRHRGELAEMEKPISWLLKTATNLSINHLRRKHLEAVWIREVMNNRQIISTERSDIKLLNAEISGLIKEAVKQLPPQRKIIYELSREAGMDRKEIAAELGISGHTVKNQLGAALKFIQQFLVQNGVDLITILCFSKIFFQSQ